MFKFLNNLFSKDEKKINIVFFIGKEISSFDNPNINRIDSDWNNQSVGFIFNYNNYKPCKKIFIDFYNQRIKESLVSGINKSHKNIIEPLLKIQNNNRFQTYFITDALDYFLENSGFKNIIHMNGLLGNFICDNEFCLNRTKSKTWHNITCPKCKQNNTIRPCINFINEYDKPFEEIEKMKNVLKKCDLFIQCFTKNESLLNSLNDDLIKLLFIDKKNEKEKENHYDFFDVVYEEKQFEQFTKINNIKSLNDINSIIGN